jgi:hypothetical protein
MVSEPRNSPLLPCFLVRGAAKGVRPSRKCRKRFWDADFQAVQTEWAVAAEDLRERRAKRLPCTCSNEERMLVDMYVTGRDPTDITREGITMSN